MDVKKPGYAAEHAARAEAHQARTRRNAKSADGNADFAAKLARCQESGERDSSRTSADQERAERVLALKKKVAEGQYRADLHEVARNLLFNDNSEPLL
ncbi:flagellar biosynthesis anti-sigma factor FlgM [Oceanidesulfovibrio marinus]|uniref:Flagellar biosynthesis anti-sigma factor FlgM n=1 Tax=Oceanidesulfovibrio marinus TaxID=370038 RepID=A0A6P1ZLG6_9BACT|nr:flagellar biosynthesis anti-sigma factor FlgM [Oceanidesulfovibrio marinus]QJT08129.1 flagellar biosynthesis anti-sigma factor FlgM [Oceanidesulfovibrio marinus]TVM35026.1 hypothetical protein DQK91_06385 [Oceanidesulfovibrio marinus]